LSAGGQLDVADVPPQMQPSAAQGPLSSDVTLNENERAQIFAVLKEVGGNRSRAAQALGISRRTLYRKLSDYAKEEGATP
ncbi:MAG: helix-turn-helix domain-containing protein, partial [Kiritimatiellia bacterium]